MLENIVAPLLDWYDSNARVLPWREEPTPYRVWVSEIMLQQTRVEAVKPYFERFITALPRIQDLADCDTDKLMKLWEGLGYYNRVRNMQTAAQTVVAEYQGQLPEDYEQLLTLKGIGSYTAGAIASIAYSIPVPAVDGNVLRVISRVLASYDDILKQTVKTRMEADIRAIMPQDRPGAFNQALMELGAMVCVPNGVAKCEVCPLAHLCLAKERGIVAELPKKTPKKARKIETRTVLVIRDGDKVALQKRPEQGLLPGLYEFPNVLGHLSEEEVLSALKADKLSPIRIQPLEESKHIFSHVEWRMKGYVIKVEEMEGFTQQTAPYLFVEAARAEDEYAIPTAFSAYTKYMNIKLGQDKYNDDK